MHRFLSQNTDFTNKTLTITDLKEIHHLANVLRLKQGSEIAVFNGKGEEALAKIQTLTTKSVQLTIVSPVKRFTSSSSTLTLACAIPKKAKFETIIEKCTELGVDQVIPMITERTEVRLSEERAGKKLSRYKTVAVNAAKQSQRALIPMIESPALLTDIIKSLSAKDAAFIPCLTGERISLPKALAQSREKDRIIILIGPEGDFTPGELSLALKAGCLPVTLGPHVLKVDTAAIVSVAIVKILAEKDNL